MIFLEKLVSTVQQLRGPEGCEWDKEQTFDSLKVCIIEEAYELVDAIESKHNQKIIEELGDYLLQVIMICTIASETNLFNLDDVFKKVNNKMIDRHPHVFQHTKKLSSQQVTQQWEDIKENEAPTDSIMNSIASFPALLKAEKIQKKAAKVNFEWPNISGAILKLEEEINEFKVALNENSKSQIEEEAGDILFSLVNVLRKCNVNSEEALRKANIKFVNRFKEMENLTEKNLKELTLEQKEQLWQQAKLKIK